MATLDTGAGELDQLFDALSRPERRQILLHLSDVGPRDDDQLTVDELVAADHNHDPDRLQRKLHHNHLPKLDDAGYVRWTPDTRTIRRGPRFDAIEPVLSLLYDHRDDLPDELP